MSPESHAYLTTSLTTSRATSPQFDPAITLTIDPADNPPPTSVPTPSSNLVTDVATNRTPMPSRGPIAPRRSSGSLVASAAAAHRAAKYNCRQGRGQDASAGSSPKCVRWPLSPRMGDRTSSSGSLHAPARLPPSFSVSATLLSSGSCCIRPCPFKIALYATRLCDQRKYELCPAGHHPEDHRPSNRSMGAVGICHRVRGAR